MRLVQNALKGTVIHKLYFKVFVLLLNLNSSIMYNKHGTVPPTYHTCNTSSFIIVSHHVKTQNSVGITCVLGLWQPAHIPHCTLFLQVDHKHFSSHYVLINNRINSERNLDWVAKIFWIPCLSFWTWAFLCILQIMDLIRTLTNVQVAVLIG